MVRVQLAKSAKALYYEGANSWHVDDDQRLHLFTDSRTPVASFAAGEWIAVDKGEGRPQ